MTQSSVNLPLTGSGDTSAKAAVKKLSTNEVVQQVELVTAVDGGALTPIASGNPLEVAIVGTVPISGAPTTVTANIGTTNGLGLDSSLQSILTKLNASVGVTGTFWQATQPVSGTFWQATQPVSGTVTANLGTLNGAATAAKQPALGTAGSASSDVLTIQGISGGTAIPVTGGGTPTDITASGSITGIGQAVSITTLNGCATVAVDVSGTFSAALIPQATVDGTNWFAIPNGSQPQGIVGVIGASGISNPSNWTIPVAGFAGFRIRSSSFSSGTAVIALRASAGTGTVILGSAIPSGASSIGTVGLNAGTQLVGKVGIDQTTPGTTNLVSLGTSTLALASQVSVTATAGTLLAAGAYKSIGFRNLSTSASSAFIGPATVSATTGMEIKPGEFYGYGPGECPSNLIQAICAAAGTATVIVQTAS